MDKELIERLAIEAGAESQATFGAPLCLRGGDIECFAALVAEECAKVAGMSHTCESSMGLIEIDGSNPLAFAIRQKFKAV